MERSPLHCPQTQETDWGCSYSDHFEKTCRAWSCEAATDSLHRMSRVRHLMHAVTSASWGQFCSRSHPCQHERTLFGLPMGLAEALAML